MRQENFALDKEQPFYPSLIPLAMMGDEQQQHELCSVNGRTHSA